MADQKEFKKIIVLPENVPVDFAFEKLLKNFMKQVDKSGVLQEVKLRKHHRKPSEIKREHAKKMRRQ
jgi:ribosomal protein S21